MIDKTSDMNFVRDWYTDNGTASGAGLRWNIYIDNNLNPCPYCSGNGTTVYHTGLCPKIKKIEYYPNGTIRSVELHD